MSPPGGLNLIDVGPPGFLSILYFVDNNYLHRNNLVCYADRLDYFRPLSRTALIPFGLSFLYFHQRSKLL